MLNFRELTLDDKPGFDKNLLQMQTDVSDFTFTNFYMWRSAYGLRVAYDPEIDYWFILATPEKWKAFFFAPLGDWGNPSKLKLALEKMTEYCSANQLQLFFRRTPQAFLKKILEIDPTFEYRKDRNTYDYVYNISEMIELSGRKYHGKRNHLNQFMRSYKWEYQPMDQSVVAECLNLRTEWFDLHVPAQEQNISGETEAMIVALENFSELKLCGGVIRIDGQIQALTVGEMLKQNMVVIHIEKANTDFKGIYAGINQQFLYHHWSNVEWVNREEDMGIEGLRKAKLSYNPAMLVEKYNVYK